MELNEYQKQAMTTCMVSCENDTYILFGLMAEVGEIADKIAKWQRKAEIAGNKYIICRDVETFSEEIKKYLDK